MKRSDFIDLVHDTLRQHPDWLANTLEAIHGGVNDALEQEREFRNRAEYAVGMLAGEFDHLPERHRPSVARVINQTAAFRGTPWALALAEKYPVTDQP